MFQRYRILKHFLTSLNLTTKKQKNVITTTLNVGENMQRCCEIWRNVMVWGWMLPMGAEIRMLGVSPILSSMGGRKRVQPCEGTVYEREQPSDTPSEEQTTRKNNSSSSRLEWWQINLLLVILSGNVVCHPNCRGLCLWPEPKILWLNFNMKKPESYQGHKSSDD